MSEQTKRDSFALKGALIFIIGALVGGLLVVGGFDYDLISIEDTEDTGLWPNGSKKDEVEVAGTSDDKLKEKNYWDNGELESEGKLVDGKRHSLWTYYREDGSKKMTTNYANGKVHGLWTKFNESGGIEHQGQYVDGNKEGKFTIWNDDGSLSVETEYREDQLHGTRTYYWGDEGKTKRKMMTYIKGQVRGQYKHWDKDGVLRVEGEYLGGMAQLTPDGKHVYYGINGKKLELFYDNGKVVSGN